MSKELQKLKARLKPLLEKAGVKQSFVFGSFARGEAKIDSDLDLIIDFNFDAGLLDLISLRIKLQKIYKSKPISEINMSFTKTLTATVTALYLGMGSAGAEEPKEPRREFLCRMMKANPEISPDGETYERWNCQQYEKSAKSQKAPSVTV